MLRLVFVITALLVAGGCVQFTREYAGATDYGRALLLYWDGRLIEAQEMAERVGPGDPSRAAAERLLWRIRSLTLRAADKHVELGGMYERAGIPVLALREYAGAQRLNPASAFIERKVSGLTGVVAGPGRSYIVDIDDIEQIIDRAPARYSTRPGTAKAGPVYRKRGEAGGAGEADIEALIAGHYARGKRLLAAGELRGSVAEFEVVLTLRPAYRDATALLGRARVALDRAVGLHLKRGIAYFQKEEMASAIRQWDAALRLDPENVVALDYKARAELIMERLEKIRKRQSR